MRFIGLLALLALAPFSAVAAEALHHQLSIKLVPATAEVITTDVITLPPASKGTTRHFQLHAGLTMLTAEPPVQLISGASTADAGLSRYAVKFAAHQNRITLRYRGRIELPPEQIHSGFGRNQQASGAEIASDSVYLDGSSHWYPVFGDQLLTFSLDVEMPPGWSAVSQGSRGQRNTGPTRVTERWQETTPQEEIYLIAAPFHETRKEGSVEKLVMLRQPDSALAEKYLGVMDHYIDLYSRLIGPYPYRKFALVENNWESGYGMPSFTLLGPRVIRLPFILHSSFPHEILHNWWGNGVYVDVGEGNWAEGLTTYLADHLLQERNGKGAAYRRDALLRYTNYVAEQADFPLSQFHARHSDASQAVGYDKALMFFHALRLQLGDRRFIEALRRFYRDQMFHRASWEDLQRAFAHETKTPLKADFEQWLQRPGAPALRVNEAHAERKDQGFELILSLEQTQPAPPYRVHIPIAVTVANLPETLDQVLIMEDKLLTARIALPDRPLHVAVDPDFDVFRRLDRAELPPTLSEALAAERVLIVLPAAAAPAQRNAYEKLARMWADGTDGVEVITDSELNSLPNDRGVWLFGWENRFREQVVGTLSGQDITFGNDAVDLAGQRFQRTKHALVLATRGGRHAQVWLGADNTAAIPGLARKLPHYGSASYLVFRGNEPTNVLKGQWRVLNSPLRVDVTQQGAATLPAVTAVTAEHKLRPPLLQLIE